MNRAHLIFNHKPSDFISCIIHSFPAVLNSNALFGNSSGFLQNQTVTYCINITYSISQPWNEDQNTCKKAKNSKNEMASGGLDGASGEPGGVSGGLKAVSGEPDGTSIAPVSVSSAPERVSGETERASGGPEGASAGAEGAIYLLKT